MSSKLLFPMSMTVGEKNDNGNVRIFVRSS